MAYKIKTIASAEKSRAYVTIEETDAQDKPTGREWTEPFDTEKKNWAELKQRFRKRIKNSNAEATAEINLIEEANNADITSIS